MELDSVQLNFNSDSLFLLNLCLAIIMFGIALDLKIEDFKRIISIPKPVLVGILSQFLVLPFLTFILVIIIKPSPSIALGMILVAACPGGNISNFMTHLAKGNAALSVTLTAFTTISASFLTPFNLSFWGNNYEPTREILQSVSLNPLDLFETIILILVLPLILGMLFNSKFPIISQKAQKVFKPLSMMIFIAFVIIAFAKNFDLFLEYVHYIFFIVLIHNAIALISGYSLGAIFGLNTADRRCLSIETGIQNSGLGLILIFSFFDGMGGMAIVAGWWGIWHVISGLSLGYVWSKIKIS